MKDIDKIELALWIGVAIVALSILFGCSSSENVKVSLVVFEATAEMNVSK